MGKKGVEDIINEIEIFVDSCKYSPLSSNKIIVPKDELESMLNEVKMKMPAEIERCKKIMRNKEAILTDAKNRAEAMIEEARQEADRMVEEHEITQAANERAKQIIDAANADADEIIDNATADAKDMRMSAMMYTKDQIDNIRLYVEKTLEAEKANFTHLIESLENDDRILKANKEEMDNQIRIMNATPQPIAAAEEDEYDEYEYENPKKEVAYAKDEYDDDDDDFAFDDDEMDY